MTSLFFRIYEYFKDRKLLAIFCLVTLLSVSAFFAFRLEMKENVAEMMPQDKRLEKITSVFQNSGFSDKLIINISLSDTLAEADPALLSRFSDSLAQDLSAGFQPELIKDIRHKISEDHLGAVFNAVYHHLPVFLTHEDYQRLDSLILSSSHLEEQMGRNYRTLVAPASMVLKKFVIQDPLGMGGNVLKKLQNLQQDQNFDLYDGHIITRDHKNVLVILSTVYPPNETGKNAPLIEGIDKLIEQKAQQFNGKVKAEYFGAAAVALGNADRIKSDIMVTVSAAISVLVIFMGLFFKRAPVVLIIFLPVAIGGLVSVAALYFLKGSVSAIALGMGAVLLGITVDYSLHIFTHYRTTGSVKAVFADLSFPLFLSCLITAASFLCLLFVKSQALKDLGLFAAISVINALIAALLVLPHFLKNKPKQESREGSLSFIERYIAFDFDKSRLLIALVVIITVISFVFAGNVQFETDMMKMNYMSEKLNKAEKNLQKISSLSLQSVYLVASGKNLEEALQASETGAERINSLLREKVILSASGVNDFLISDSLQKIRINAWNQYWTSEKKAFLKKTLVSVGEKYKFKEQAFASFFNLLDKSFEPASTNVELEEIKTLLFDDYIAENKELSTIVTVLKVDDRYKETLNQAFSDAENLTLIDRRFITGKFVELMKDDFNTLEVLSLGLVFLVLVLSYGRIELGVIAFVPLILSWIWTLGIMGLLGVKFNIVNIIISTFILGLGIDYSIFIMTGLIEEYRTGVKHLASYKTSIFLSAFTSITGIGALIFAQHPSLKSVAVLSIIGMCSVITISFIVQPLLFRYLITSRTRKGFHPYTAQSLFVTGFAYGYFLFGCLLLTIFANIIFPLLPITLKNKKRAFHWLLTYFSRSMVYIMFNVKKKIINPEGEDFSKPALVICNHQSFLDILLTIMLCPKTILVTNDWVWNSPFFGRVVKYADFFPASNGIENGVDELKHRFEEGYSVVIFPEGTRSQDGKIGRFHKGAFFIAEKLGVDLLPVILHGTGDTITKGDFLLKNGNLTVKFLPRITPENTGFGSSYQERSKLVARYMREEYSALAAEVETPDYFRDRLVKNYIYKGPVLENYMKVKTSLEKNYKFFDNIIPRDATIVDLGCGYGFLSYMLLFTGRNRNILGVDYDAEKIKVASNCFSRQDNISFMAADITGIDLPDADIFVLADVLHYLSPSQQELVIKNCIRHLNNNGFIIIREGNSELKDKHIGTQISEFFSVKLLKFNKSEQELSFLSTTQLKKICEDLGAEIEILDNTRLTSNTFYLLKKSNAEMLAV